MVTTVQGINSQKRNVHRNVFSNEYNFILSMQDMISLSLGKSPPPMGHLYDHILFDALRRSQRKARKLLLTLKSGVSLSVFAWKIVLNK